MSRKKKIIIASLIAVFLIAGIVLIQNKKQSKKIDNKYFSYEVGTNTFESYIEADGSVKSDNTKKIYVQQSLQVDKVLVKLGDYVKKGQVLLTFNSSDRDEVIRNIAKESANLSQLERNYNSYKKLYAAGGAARIDYQTIETSIQQSRIAIAQYRANLDKMPIDIISPVDGTITALTADENYRVNTQVNLLEIEDLTNRSSKILSNLDYQILVAMTGIVGEDKVAEEFGVTKGYIRKLMRSADGSEFLKEQAKAKAEMSLAVSTNMVNAGIQLWQNHIGELMQKGQTELVLYNLFGKQSLSEVQAGLHKQQSAVPEDNGNSLLNLFASISVNNGGGK